MKKLLTGVVAIVVLLVLATSVNASSVKAEPASANTGDTVTVTVSMAETRSVGVYLKYDTDKFEFINATSSIGDLTKSNKDGVVRVAGSDTEKTTTSVVFTFKAKGTTEGASFEVTRLTTQSNETAPTTPATVVVSEGTSGNTEEGTSTEETTAEGTTDTENGAQSTGEKATTATKVDDQGNKITKLPQTGVPYMAIAGIALVIVASAIIIRKK